MNGTQRRAAMMTYIADHIEDEGYPPTMSQIAAAVGYSPLSKQSVSNHLDELEAQGLLTRRQGSPRSIQITKTITE